MRMITMAVILIGLATPGMAQYYSTPNFGSANQYGSTTTTPNGTITTIPNFGDANQYGSTSSLPNGRTCHTTANFGNASQYGSTTTCN